MFISYIALKAGGLPKLDLKNISLDMSKMTQKLPYDPEKEYDAVVIGGGSGGNHKFYLYLIYRSQFCSRS